MKHQARINHKFHRKSEVEYEFYSNPRRIPRSDHYQYKIYESSYEPDIISAFQETFTYQDPDKLENQLRQEILIDGYNAIILKTAKSELSPRQYQVFILYIFENKSQKEIGKICNINQTSIHKVLFGNIDYKNGRRRYGGAFHRLQKILLKTPKFIEIGKYWDCDEELPAWLITNYFGKEKREYTVEELNLREEKKINIAKAIELIEKEKLELIKKEREEELNRKEKEMILMGRWIKGRIVNKGKKPKIGAGTGCPGQSRNTKKLTDEEVIVMRYRLKKGAKIGEVAKQYGLSYVYVYEIKAGKKKKYVD